MACAGPASLCHHERSGLFGGLEDDPLDDSMSLVASDVEDWAVSTNDPTPLPFLKPIDARNGMDTELLCPSLHTMAVLQVFQAKLLRSMDESEPNPAVFRELRSATDLALRATK